MIKTEVKPATYFFLFAFLILSLIIAVMFGSFSLLTNYSFTALSDTQLLILLNLRLPRVICCALVGALLACCGVISQGLLKNPLACPYTLGISQLVALILFCFMFLPPLTATAIALLILLALIMLIFKLSQISFHQHNFSLYLILFGLAVGSFCSSLILALQYSLDGISLLLMTRWLMGSIAVTGYTPVLVLSLLLAIFLPVCLFKSRQLDLLAFGDEFALSKGVPVARLSLDLSCWLLLCVAIIVWFVGPISFVGLIVPHIARLLGFTNHRQLLPGSAIIGAILLTVCDTLARVSLSPMELPIGIITGIIGTPVFVVLLIRKLLEEK